MTDTNRRHLLAGLATLPALGSAEAIAAPQLSLRLAELKAEFDVVADELDMLSTLPPEDADEAWNATWAARCELAWEIMKEPVSTWGDFLCKADVWDRAMRTEADSDDMEDRIGWGDRAPLRLVSDARRLLGIEV